MKRLIHTLAAGVLCAPLLLGGCYSHKAAGAATGASWGTTIGQAVGAIAGGGSKNYGWGTLIGMAGGAAVGAGVGAAMDRKQQGTPPARGVADDDIYYAPADGSPAAGASGQPAAGSSVAPAATLRAEGRMPLEVSDLQWEDDGDATLRSGESARLTFRVANRSQRTLSDVAPVIVETTGTRRVTLSPPLSIGRLEPGAAVRYTAAVVSTGRMKAGELRFRIHMAQGATQVSDAVEIAVATGK